MPEFKVSVIIPFYNAREFIARAVESALAQPETGEVLLIEDGSPDGGLEVCQSLAQKYSRVRLFQHPNGQNLGPSASRNLGILNAACPYIAFLDADDYYLPGRFQKTAEVFAASGRVDGVYEALGVTYQNDAVKELFLSSNLRELTTVTQAIDPENLFDELMTGKSGYFSFDAFTGKKEIFFRVGMFREDIRFLEDSDLLFKLCAKAKLYPGNINTPIAVRQVHENNRITTRLADERQIYQSYLTMWWGFYGWAKKNLSTKRAIQTSIHLLDRIRKSDYFYDFRWLDFFVARREMLRVAWDTPVLFFKWIFWRMLLPSSKCFSTRKRESSGISL